MILTTKNNKAMKTNNYSTALIAIFTLIFSASVFASEINFKEEAYINDIPFDTEMIYNNLMNENIAATFSFNDEAYINDIPFDTEEVVAVYFDENIVSLDFDEETYVDDIPFNTSAIATDYLYKNAVQVVFNFENEEEINDIPFNTHMVIHTDQTDNSAVFYSAIYTPVAF